MSGVHANIDVDNTAQSMTTESENVRTRHLGMCKWFDKMKGFGFIQCLGSEQTDFFVHHSQLGTVFANNKGQHRDEDIFRYLVAGEYVEFGVCEKTTLPEAEPSEEKTNERLMASSVTGPMGGPLMYQTQMQQQEELNEKYSNQRTFDDASNSNHGFTRVIHRRKPSYGKGKGKGKGWWGKGAGKGKHTVSYHSRHATDAEQVHRNQCYQRPTTDASTPSVNTSSTDTNQNAYAALVETPNEV